MALKNEDLLELLLGQKSTLIPDSTKKKLWGEDWNNIHLVQIHHDFLTPICYSLKRLELFFESEDHNNLRTACNTCQGFIYKKRVDSSIAFI